MHTTPRRTVRALAAAAMATALLAGCGDDDSESGSADPTPSESATSTPATTPEGSESASSETTEPAGPTLEIRVTGDKVTPNGELLSATKGEPITLTFDSDRAGELHVHSKPEQYVEFEPGTSTKKIVIDTPGVVEIEEHESGIVIAQLEVK